MAPALALGVSLPPTSAHALSVSMPQWAHVVGYEENDAAVLAAMACGYPRFFYHPFVVTLTKLLSSRAPFADFFPTVNGDNEHVWSLALAPTLVSARRLQSFLIASAKNDPAVVDISAEQGDVDISGVRNLVWVVRYPRRLTATAKQFWQHSGEIVSSRHAQLVLEVLNDETPTIAATIIAPRLTANRTATHKQLHERVASLYLGANSNSSDVSENVFVYPTGMGAIFASVRLASKLRPDAKSILFGFPYVDTLKILSRVEWCAKGVYFFPVCGEKELLEVEAILKREPIFGVFTEFPGNPLLSTPDLSRLGRLAHDNGTVLVVDDTVGSYNVNVMSHDSADIVTTSLSKIFSGTCDIMGGSIVLNPTGPLYNTLKQNIAQEDAFIVEEDARVLLETSVDVHKRLAKVNTSASVIAKRLHAHPLVESTFYPELQEDPTQFTKFLSNPSSDGAPQFGPLLSIVLKGGLPVATAFYDAVNIAKGPSLGTNFTMCCPYTLLAHYNELDFAESCGVDRNLLRISVGLEDTEEIWETINSALQAAITVYESESA